jgi:hypothetical protein
MQTLRKLPMSAPKRPTIRYKDIMAWIYRAGMKTDSVIT